MSEPLLKHILLVDDDDVTNFIHEDTLREINAAEDISIAENGILAFDVITNSLVKPEIIFLDINMPEMNGISFLENFENRLPQYKPVIIIMLTTQLTKADVDRINKVKHLITAYLDKPVNNTTFKTLLAKYF